MSHVSARRVPVMTRPSSITAPITRALLELGPAGYLSDDEADRRRKSPPYMAQLVEAELGRATRLARSRGWIR